MSTSDVTHYRRRVWSYGLMVALLTFLWAGQGFAANVELEIDGADVAVDPDTLDQAFTQANQAAAASLTDYDTTVDLTINASGVKTSGTGTGLPAYFLHGSGDPSVPTTTPRGFDSVSIIGGGTGISIGFADNATDKTRVIEIINVQGSINLEKLTITGGSLASTTGSLVGGGLYLGATNQYAGQGIHAGTIGLKSVTVAKNTLSVDSDSGDARGGGAHVDATDYGTANAGGKIVFDTVTFTGNAVTVKASGPTGSGAAYGGGVYVSNATEFTYTGGAITDNTATTTNSANSHGGGIAIESYTHKATLSQLTISGNTAVADSTGTSFAYGGGLYARHDGVDHGDGNDHLILTVTNTTFEKNQALAKGTGSTSAFGGGAYIDAHTLATFDKVTFSENAAISDSANAAGGGIASQSDRDVTITASSLTGNAATAKNGEAYGGGIYAAGALTLTGSSVSENKVTAKTAGMGGGVHAANFTADGSELSKNEVNGEDASGGGLYASGTIDLKNGTTVVGNSITATDTGLGGGIYVDSDTTHAIAKSTIDSNTIKAGETAQGAGLFVNDGTVTITDTAITNNTITAGRSGHGAGVAAMGESTFTKTSISKNSISGVTHAFGGGIHTSSTSTFTDSTIADNAINASETAQGGGIYVENSLTLTDTSVTGNSVTGGTKAFGGGIYQAVSGTTSTITIATTAGKSASIKGNTVSTGGVTSASGIHIGGTDTNTAAALNINSAGTFNLVDPLTVTLTGLNATFTLNRSEAGRFNWGGANVFQTTAGTTLNLNTGSNFLEKTFTANAEGDMSVDISGEFGFDGTRDTATALFTYDGTATGNSFAIDAAADLRVDMSSELLGGTITHLVAEKYTGDASFDGQVYNSGDDQSVIEYDATTQEIRLTTHYVSAYQDIIDVADPNTQSAIASGALPDLFRRLTADERADLTAGSLAFNTATPGFILNSAIAGKETVVSGAATALRYGLDQFGTGGGPVASAGNISASGWANLDPALARTGSRFWAGYLGDFDRMDSHSGYYGYKANRHGVIAGVTYDAGAAGSIGLYGGYSHTKTKAKDIRAVVTSDTGHVGVIARLSPLRNLPNLNIIADAGFTFSTNDSERGSGLVLTTGEFDQKYYTVGLEGNYSARFGAACATPFVSARYIKIRQHEFLEEGALATTMDDLDENAFTTRIGIALGLDLATGFGRISPSLSAAWRHDFGDRQYAANAFYNGAAVPTYYQVKSAAIDRDAAELGAAIRTLINLSRSSQIGVNAGYMLTAGSNRKNHSLYIGVDVGF